MSSMFKKKGGLAFKPKIPSARPRPPAPAAAPSKPAEHRLSTGTEAAAVPSADAQTPEATSQAPPPEPSLPASGQKQPPSRAQEQSSQPPQEPAAPAESNSQPSLPPQEGSGLAAVETQEESPPPVTERKAVEVDPQLEAAEARSDETVQLPTPAPTARPPTPVPPPVENHDCRPHEHLPDATPGPVPGSETQLDGSEPTPPVVEPASEPARKPAKRTRPPAVTTTTTTTTTAEGDGDGPARPKKRQRKGSQQGGEPAVRKPRKRGASATAGDGSEAKSRPGRVRSATPEDAESQQVDLQQLKMADLTKDLRIGKKFSRHDELRERERQARLRAKLGRDSEPADGVESGGSASPLPESQTKQSATPGGSATPAPAATAGPQFRIVDGQIVVDQSSLIMDRHARAAAAQAGQDMETIEENDFTRLITSSSFMNTSKLRGPNIWTDEETELFYRGLRMFGTEFEMISKMFPGKQRRHVKLKFNREERHNPKRIDAALIGEKTIKMDIDEYRAFTGAEYESVETIEAEQRKIQDGYEAERQRIADEQAEIMRKKREELFADEDGEDNGGKGKKGKRKGKQAVAYGLNGEPIAQES